MKRDPISKEQRLLDDVARAELQLMDARKKFRANIRGAAKQGLSIRQIAAAAGLSPTRVHQILREEKDHA